MDSTPMFHIVMCKCWPNSARLPLDLMVSFLLYKVKGYNYSLMDYLDCRDHIIVTLTCRSCLYTGSPRGRNTKIPHPGHAELISPSGIRTKRSQSGQMYRFSGKFGTILSGDAKRPDRAPPFILAPSSILRSHETWHVSLGILRDTIPDDRYNSQMRPPL